jgi:hypothetical protein
MTGPIRLWRNRQTGRKLLAAEEPNGDVIDAELDENDHPISAGNRIPKDEWNQRLDELEMDADYNTVGFTVFDGKIIEREMPERL